MAQFSGRKTYLSSVCQTGQLGFANMSKGLLIYVETLAIETTHKQLYEIFHPLIYVCLSPALSAPEEALNLATDYQAAN